MKNSNETGSKFARIASVKILINCLSLHEKCAVHMCSVNLLGDVHLILMLSDEIIKDCSLFLCTNA